MKCLEFLFVPTMKCVHFLCVLLSGFSSIAYTQDEIQNRKLTDSLTNSAPQVSLSAYAHHNNGYAPLWANANLYGMVPIKGSSVQLRTQITGEQALSETYPIRLQYGADLSVVTNYGTKIYINQLYADFIYKKTHLLIGTKFQPLNLKHQRLSSGAFTFGKNARTEPRISIEIPNYIKLISCLGVKGYFGYGYLTDGNWQSHYVPKGSQYIKNGIQHSKALFLRLKHPSFHGISLEGGFEMACLFGGTLYNPSQLNVPYINLSHNYKDFISAIYSGQSDPTDGVYPNAQGNTVGSYLARLNYERKNWKVAIYYDHLFEDHSQMFFEYGAWRDGLWGIEVNFPKNRYISTFVYELIKTDHQSGPIYHDRTEAIPIQISAADNYYNHNIYNGWMHFGQAIGLPFFLSPLYNTDKILQFKGNRFIAHHIGFEGQPTPVIFYRALFSTLKGWGTYNIPFTETLHQTSFLLEGHYIPHSLKGWKFMGSISADFLNHSKNHYGISIGIEKSFN